jgi:hypothetical protein
MSGINSTTIASSVRSLNDIQRKAYQEALNEADGGTSGDGILTKEELNKGNEAFFKTDDFKSLSEADQKSFKEKVNADAVWGQQGAVNYDGNKLQIEYYEKALKEGKKDKDGNPIVTEEQLKYAKEHGFGDTNNDKQITGSELSADINGDTKIDSKDGDITGDGKVSSADKGVDLRTPEAKAGGDAGGGMKISANAMMSFLDQLMTIWKLK